MSLTRVVEHMLFPRKQEEIAIKEEGIDYV